MPVAFAERDGLAAFPDARRLIDAAGDRAQRPPVQIYNNIQVIHSLQYMIIDYGLKWIE